MRKYAYRNKIYHGACRNKPLAGHQERGYKARSKVCVLVEHTFAYGKNCGKKITLRGIDRYGKSSPKYWVEEFDLQQHAPLPLFGKQTSSVYLKQDFRHAWNQNHPNNRYFILNLTIFLMKGVM